MPEIVVVFIGYQAYIMDTIKQLAHINPGKTIHFIGDKPSLPTDLLKIVKFYQYDDLLCQEFMNIYKNYMNYSTNNLDFERINMLRWVLIRNLAKKEGYQKIFATDCDILYYESVNLGYENFKEYEFTLCANTSAHTTYINNLSVLDDYIKILDSFYGSCQPIKIGIKEVDIKFLKYKLENEYKLIIANNKTGGICDMTFWKILKEQYPAGLVAEMCEIKEDTTYDHTIFECDGYEMSLENTKNIVFNKQDKYPLIYNKILNKKIKFKSIHFQGPAKKEIIKYLIE